MTTPDPYRLVDPYLPAGPGGPLLLPPAVARLTWPAVEAYLEDLRDRGALETVRAAGPALNRWHSVYLAGSGFRSETVDSGAHGDGRPSQHDEWISTADAANRLGCSTTWVNTLARRDDLASRLVGRVRLVSARSVEEHRQRRS